jgi:hypothetical protein
VTPCFSNDPSVVAPAGDRSAHAVLIDAVNHELDDDWIGDLRGRAALRNERRRRSNDEEYEQCE